MANWNYYDISQKTSTDYYVPNAIVNFHCTSVGIEADNQLIHIDHIDLSTNEVSSYVVGGTDNFTFESNSTYFVKKVVDISTGKVVLANDKLRSMYDVAPHTDVYGTCNDKCRVKIEPTKDSGWITLVETNLYDEYAISEPIQYRKINNVIYIRGRIDKILIPANTFDVEYLVKMYSSWDNAPERDIIQMLSAKVVNSIFATSCFKILHENGYVNIYIGATSASKVTNSSGLSITFNEPFYLSYVI